MPGPAFAVTGRRQQAVDNNPQCFNITPPVSQEGVNLFGGRRQTGQVKRHASNQRQPIGSRRRLQSRRLQPGLDERVDRRDDSVGVGHLRYCRRLHRPERPVVLFLVGELACGCQIHPRNLHSVADRQFGLQAPSLPVGQHAVEDDHLGQVALEAGRPLLGTSQCHAVLGPHLHIGHDRGAHRVTTPHLLRGLSV